MYMYIILLALAISVSGRTHSSDVLLQEWQLFKLEHSKVYGSLSEERLRNIVYLSNKQKIINHNRLYELGQVSFKLGLNKFSDLTHQEFIAQMNRGFNGSLIKFDSESETFIAPYFDVPESVDWRRKGAVTKVKDQGQCGSCWAFAVTGALEGQYFLKSGKLVSMSEQNLVDCDKMNNGCNGGNMDVAFKYIRDNGGIDTENGYPYEARGGQCRYDRSFDSGATVKGFTDIPQGKEDLLKKAVATIGPIAVGIDASNPSFQHYADGVYYEPECTPKHIDHAVLIVGYGTTKGGKDYWVVKNSWAINWGDNGYVLMARNSGNHCGIASMASFPRV